MKQNEARILFRVVAGLIALAWLMVLVFVTMAQKVIDWRLSITFLTAAIAFGYVAIAGYMPGFFVRLFCRGSGPADEDIR